MGRAHRLRTRATIALLGAASFAGGCGSKEAPPSPPCEEKCRDGVALRALRETMKYAYNQTIQGNPVGPQDETTSMFLAGSARVFGQATSDPLLGTTKVDLTYVFTNARYLQKDDEPEENYDVVVDGTLTQLGVLSVQPSATTALIMRGSDVSIQGEIYDPPLPFAESGCMVEITQSGNSVAGKFCSRKAGFDF